MKLFLFWPGQLTIMLIKDGHTLSLSLPITFNKENTAFKCEYFAVVCSLAKICFLYSVCYGLEGLLHLVT